MFVLNDLFFQITIIYKGTQVTRSVGAVVPQYDRICYIVRLYILSRHSTLQTRQTLSKQRCRFGLQFEPKCIGGVPGPTNTIE